MHYMFSYCNLKYTSFLSRQCSRMNELVAAVMNKYVQMNKITPSQLSAKCTEAHNPTSTERLVCEVATDNQ